MRVPKNLGSFAAALACINLLVPLQLLQAADPPAATGGAAVRSSSVRSLKQTPQKTAKLVTRDVALGPANGLRGQLVDKSGARLANRNLFAVHSDESILQSVSDANGNFHFPRAKPGIYLIVSKKDGSYQVCRCWAANTAPPVAAQAILLVEGDQTLRGQRPIGELLSGPVLIGLIIAAAIIIPIAVHNSQKSAS